MSVGLDLEVLANELAAVIKQRVAAENASLTARVAALEQTVFLADALKDDGGAK
jgi:hypothetical protein